MDYDDEFDSSMQNPLAVEQLNYLLPEDIRVFSCTCFQCPFSKDTRVSKSFNPHLNTHTRIDTAKFQKALSVFLGTHSMKNYSGSIQYIPCSCFVIIL